MYKVSTFNERLKFAISIRGYTQSQLANLTGINKSLICDYLKGRCLAKQDKLDKISKVLRVSPVWLMGYDCGINGEEKKDDITPPLKNIIIHDIVNICNKQDEPTLKTILKVIQSLVE